MGQLYLDEKDCRNMFSDKNVYVFGTGVDAEVLYEKLSEKLHILAYVDNYRSGENRKFKEKDIISAERLMEIRKNEPILIATNNAAAEISKQLDELGLESGTDYYVWDYMNIFHSDENIDNYVTFLKNVWEKHKRKNKSRKVIIPYYNLHEAISVNYAYCGNYFAEKYDASIYCYYRFNGKKENVSPVIEKIYKAFNVEDIIDSALSEELKTEADKIENELWDEIKTWEDWNHITVYGINFGPVIVSYLLRFFIPSFDVRDDYMHRFFRKCLDVIVFWYHYYEENEVCVTLLGDGVTSDGFIREISVEKGIPTYEIDTQMKRLKANYMAMEEYLHFDKLWDQLTEKEQKNGLKWAKERIEKRLKGGIDEVWDPSRDKYIFALNKKTHRVLEANDKLKILICPHKFEENSLACGTQIFDNNYFAWLCHLGELSEKTPNYDWYLKLHPNAARRDFIIINMFVKEYPKIKLLPADISPYQLKEEGIRYALTIRGTIGHEYPPMGIQVINAGVNPHDCFDFTWNPKSKEEFDSLIINLDKLKPKDDMDGLYRFYCLNYLYYNWEYLPYKRIFFPKEELGLKRNQLATKGKDLGSWIYKNYMKEWSSERHEKLWGMMEYIFELCDKRQLDILYRKWDETTEFLDVLRK